jgi:hypothetical protein
VYSLTVTLFSLLLGTGIGSILSRRIGPSDVRQRLRQTLVGIVATAGVAIVFLPSIISAAISASHPARILLATALLVPAGVLMGIPLPAGVRLLAAGRPDLVPWAWGINGALSVIGATLAVFIAMNWGFSVTLLAGAALYLSATLCVAGPVPGDAGG